MKVVTLTIEGRIDSSLEAGDRRVGGLAIDVEVKLHVVIAYALHDEEEEEHR